MPLLPKNILKSSILIIVISIILVLMVLVLKLIPNLLAGPEAEIVSLISNAFSFMSYPLFFVLYLWAGMRAAKKFGMDASGAGIVGAFSFFASAIIRLFMEMMLSLVFASHIIAGTFVSEGATIAVVIFGDSASGGTGLAMSALCGFGLIAVGTLINFAVAGFGGMMAYKPKTRMDDDL